MIKPGKTQNKEDHGLTDSGQPGIFILKTKYASDTATVDYVRVTGVYLVADAGTRHGVKPICMTMIRLRAHRCVKVNRRSSTKEQSAVEPSQIRLEVIFE